MRLGIIGSGRIGGNAGKLFAKASHEVMFSFSRDDDEEAKNVVAALIVDSGFDPVFVGSLFGAVVWMEPPRREGALYGEEFHLQETRETVARLTGR